MSDDNDKIMCYFRGKGYTGQEDYPCPLIGQCDCNDCFIVASAVKKAIEDVCGQIQGKEESEIENYEEAQDPESSVLFELTCDGGEDGEKDNEHSVV